MARNTQPPFAGKVVAITGVGSGMGRTLAERFGRDGAQLALAEINADTLAETASLARNAGAASVMTTALDVSSAKDVEAWAKDVKKQLGNADVVINNAGIAYIASFEEQDMDYFERIMNVNFWGVVYSSRAFMPQLRETSGSLVNTSSIFGLIGAENNSAYCAAKFAVRGINETLWQEMKDSGVHIGSVHPGGIKTNIARLARVDTKTNRDFVERFDEIAKTSPEKAAEVIYRGIKKRQRRILIGMDASLISGLTRLLPNSYDRFLTMVFGNDLQS